MQPKEPDTIQKHQIFYSRYLVKNKVYNLVIDNGSYENIISNALVDYLKLETESHLHPYTIGWIKKGPLHKGNESSPYFNWQVLLRFSYLWCCWYGCVSLTSGTTMTTRRRCYLSWQEEHLHVHLGGQENCHEAYSTTTKAWLKKKSQSSHRYATEVNSLWNPRKQSNILLRSSKKKSAQQLMFLRSSGETDIGRVLKNSSWWASGRATAHDGYPAPHWSSPRSKSIQPLTLPDESKGEWGSKGEDRRTDSKGTH